MTLSEDTISGLIKLWETRAQRHDTECSRAGTNSEFARGSAAEARDCIQDLKTAAGIAIEPADLTAQPS